MCTAINLLLAEQHCYSYTNNQNKIEFKMFVNYITKKKKSKTHESLVEE